MCLKCKKKKEKKKEKNKKILIPILFCRTDCVGELFKVSCQWFCCCVRGPDEQRISLRVINNRLWFTCTDQWMWARSTVAFIYTLTTMGKNFIRVFTQKGISVVHYHVLYFKLKGFWMLQSDWSGGIVKGLSLILMYWCFYGNSSAAGTCASCIKMVLYQRKIKNHWDAEMFCEEMFI